MTPDHRIMLSMLSRFGDHNCVEALEDIEEGEEIFVSYNYNLKKGFVPRWFRALYAREYPDKAH